MFHENHPFSLDIGNLILCNHVCLLEDFDREIITSCLLLGQEDGAESTFGNGLDDFKVLDGGRCRP